MNSKKPTPPPFGIGKSSAPKEPSKLRNTIIAADDSENENPSPPASVPAQAPTVNGIKPMVPAATNTLNNINASNTLKAADWAHDPKGYAMAMGEDELPIYSFGVRMPVPKFDHRDARAYAMARPMSKLPKFDFSDCGKAADTKAAPVASTSTSAATPAPKAFDFAAAGMKPVAGLKDGEWECTTCMLKNPAAATEKCETCETPRPGAKKAAAPTFDWAGAGMKPLPTPKDGEWECSTCMLKNPASATEKCTTCEAPKPGAAKAPAPTFNWGAAGLKMAEKPAGGEWTCSTCMLQNPPTAVAKCTVCESPR